MIRYLTYGIVAGCIWLFGTAALHAQNEKVKPFRVVKTGPSPVQAGTAPLLDGRSHVEGYYLARKVSDQRVDYYLMTREGRQINFPALTEMYYSRQADRIFTVGDDLFSHIVGLIYFGVYSSSGQKVHEPELIGQFPYTVTGSERGELYIAAQGTKAGEEGKLLLSQIEKSGRVGWQSSMELHNPVSMAASRDGRYLGLIQNRTGLVSTSIVWVLDARNGRVIQRYEGSATFLSMEFLANQKVALVSSTQWMVFSLQGGFSPQFSGTLPGNPLGAYPVSAHPTDNWFVITSLADPQFGADYRVTAINSQNGKKINEQVFQGKPEWQPYRLAEVLANGRIELITSAELIELELDE